MHKPSHNYIITGTSGTGKTTLIESLRQRGFQVFNEAQRDVLTEQLANDGPALPSKNPERFLRALMERCNSDLEEARTIDGPRFFDRGIPDIAAYAIRFGVDPETLDLVNMGHEYNQMVFILPPWREIFIPDELRGKSFEEYVEFHAVITRCYERLGFKFVVVPMVPVHDRVSFVLSAIKHSLRFF